MSFPTPTQLIWIFLTSHFRWDSFPLKSNRNFLLLLWRYTFRYVLRVVYFVKSETPYLLFYDVGHLFRLLCLLSSSLWLSPVKSGWEVNKCLCPHVIVRWIFCEPVHTNSLTFLYPYTTVNYGSLVTTLERLPRFLVGSGTCRQDNYELYWYFGGSRERENLL